MRKGVSQDAPFLFCCRVQIPAPRHIRCLLKAAVPKKPVYVLAIYPQGVYTVCCGKFMWAGTNGRRDQDE